MNFDSDKYPIFPPRPTETQAPFPPPGSQYYAPREDAPPPAGGIGGIRLFRVFGITVFLHWSWFIVALIQIQRGRGAYSSVAWNVAEYVTLFLIVLMHEFGHSLACRSVGGQANQITLWPLGGIAYVSPPPRPGPTLWSIAAGPLVNVALLPITWLLYSHSHEYEWGDNLQQFWYSIFKINAGLLIFNILPIYPLDGGQILQSFLWFFIGRARSLLIAAWIGIIGAGGFMLLALYAGNWFLIAIAAFAAMIAWKSVKTARLMLAYGIRD